MTDHPEVTQVDDLAGELLHHAREHHCAVLVTVALR
jgi:hypothetical protein